LPLGQPDPVQQQAGTMRPTNAARSEALQVPTSRPHPITDIVDVGPAPTLGESVEIASSSSRRGIADGVVNSILATSNAAAPPPAPKPVAHPPRISRMMEGNLIHRVQPLYPSAAKAARIQGPVVLRAVISKEGTIENLAVQSGHPMLVKAAIDAVRQWRYRPYLLNGDPFEVETQVTVNFVLN
jgi:protein TonB